MPKLAINLKWESNPHYLVWAQFLDKDYDPDMECEPRIFVAHYTRSNVNTCACALLNCDGEQACTDKGLWARVVEAIKALPSDIGVTAFEDWAYAKMKELNA